MSLIDSLHLSVAGISAQTNQLGIIGTNIANVSTTGYKAGTADFKTVMADTYAAAPFQADSVRSTVRYHVANQGAISTTTASTNLAVNGQGFFVVKSPGGQTLMTRAGSFTADGTGNLVNASGYTLLGYNQKTGALEPVNVTSGDSTITLGANGLMSTTLSNGGTGQAYRIPLATVRTPDNMTSVDKDVYQPSTDSGAMQIGTVDANGMGSLASSSLEGSTTDIATELTTMISTQRAYEANSKAMTISSDMLSSLLTADV